MNNPSSTDSLKTTLITIEVAIRLGLLLLLATWCFLIVTPFILPVMWGMIIAVAIFPLFTKLKSVLGGRNKLATILYTLIALAFLMVPAVMIADSVIDTAHILADKHEQGELTVSPPDDSVKEWPIVGEKLYEVWGQASSNLDATIEKYRPELRAISEKLIATAASASATVLVFVISIVISGVFVANAAGAYNFTVRLFSRLINQQQGVVYTNLSRDTIRSIAQGVLGIAVIQATLSGIGMYIMDVPAWGLWTLFILGLAIMQLPPLLVLGFVIVYVISVAETTPAVIFTVYAMIISFSDTFLKPLLLGRGVSTPMLVVLLGAIGGMVVDGVIGLFVGAVVLALGYELFMAWLSADETQSGDA